MNILPIKVTLLETISEFELELKLVADPQFDVVEIITDKLFDSQKYKQGGSFKGIVIINIEKANIEWVVFSGLLLETQDTKFLLPNLKIMKN